MDAIGEYEEDVQRAHFPAFKSEGYYDDDNDVIMTDQPLSGLPDLSELVVHMETVDEVISQQPLPSFRPPQRQVGDALFGEAEIRDSIAILATALTHRDVGTLGVAIQETIENDHVKKCTLDGLTPESAEKQLGVPLSLVSEIKDERTFHGGVAAFSMASFGGPVGATLRFLPREEVITLVSNQNGITLIDPRPNQLAQRNDRILASQGQFFMAPLGGYDALCEPGHTDLSVCEYLSEYYSPHSTACETRIYVPATPPVAKDKEELYQDKPTVVREKSPGVNIGNLTLSEDKEGGPLAGVSFQSEETEGGKRKHVQPAPGSPMRIESEESEEKRTARVVPTKTSSVSTTSTAVESDVKPKRKSTTISTPVAVPKTTTTTKPVASVKSTPTQQKKE